MSKTSDMVRKMFGEEDTKRDAGLTTPEDVLRYDNISYGEDPKYQLLDVYRPKGKEGKLPVIISVHGGGWVYGDKEVYQFYCMSLAQRGFAVVNFSYRLAPENKFPSSLEDTNTVCQFVMDHSEEYGFDLDNIFAVGDSAGAHNLSLYAAILTNKEYSGNYPFMPPKGFKLKAIALNCGAFLIDVSKEDLTSQLMDDFLPQGGSEEEIHLISPIYHICENYPPVFLMSAVDDFLKNQPGIIIPEFTKKEIPFVYHFFGDKQNRLGHVFHCNIRLKDATICNDEECNFFKEFIS